MHTTLYFIFYMVISNSFAHDFVFSMIISTSSAHDFVFSMIISTSFAHDFVFYILYGNIELFCTRLCYFYDNFYLVCTWPCILFCVFYDNIELMESGHFLMSCRQRFWLLGEYMIVITGKERVGKLDGSDVWRMTSHQLLPFAPSRDHLTETQVITSLP